MIKNPLTIQLAEAKQHGEHGRNEIALAMFDNILREIPADIANNEQKEIRLESLLKRGRLLQEMGRQKEALETGNQYYLEAGNSRHTVQALVFLGSQQNVMGDLELAIRTLSEAKTLAEALNDTEGRATVHLMLGNYLYRLGRLEEALYTFQKSKSLYEQLGDGVRTSDLWANMGLTYASLGSIDEAINAYHNGLGFELSPIAQAHIFLNLGESYAALYAREKALGHFRKAWLLIDNGSLIVQADILRNIGIQLFYLGQGDQAIVSLTDGLALAEQAQDVDMTMQNLGSIAVIEAERGNGVIARQYADRLLEQANVFEAKSHQAQAMFALGRIEVGEQNFMKAEEYWQRGLFLAHEVGNRYLQWQIHVGLAEIAQSPSLVEAHYNIAGNIIKQILYPIEDKGLRKLFLQESLVQKVLENAGITNLTP